MKKFLAALLVLVLSLSMMACGSTESNSASTSDGNDSSGTDNYIADSGTGSDEDYDEDEDWFEDDSSDDEVFLQSFDTSPTIEETVLWDEQDVKVTATSLEYDGYYANLNLTFENNADKTLEFNTGSLAYSQTSVNGYMMDGAYIDLDVEAGSSEEEQLCIDTDDLMEYGVYEIADIMFGFRVYDEDNNYFELTPQKIETSAVGSYDYNTDHYGSVK